MASSEPRWNFVALEKTHQKDTFDCGYPNLNEYLKKYARQNHNKSIAKTFAAISPSGSLKIEGYYTVSASTIEYESLPPSDRSKIPAYPVPAALIGKLAVDRSAQGKGLGGELLVDALLRSLRASQEIAIYAVRVDAIDERAKEFYLKYEFIPFEDRPLSLFLPLATIAREFA
ncbi:GNAT family N-acetyltransferase [Merismopedia glauca]|uniref:GNAT family N-acetyltransferase n=1 Tax=Merismopedia glauca CCAP 1448/3 TaxID=1296344 RepID=A0A2T1C0R1_9CYAN|nr:GNAT family N-acetyltransferase [Merismopedia glauca]PSB01850.1 GNAT family N-acetyltransferase [Merismopedia glauca CCAP 1448/3]